MDKPNTSAEEMNLTEALSGDSSEPDAAVNSASLSSDDDILQTTVRMEELWDKLASVWPAVRKNPEVANKIEKLWRYLKEAENEHLILPAEIEELINQSLPDTPPPASTSHTNIVTESSIEPVTSSAMNTSSSAAEIDDLLAEILGESYRLATNPVQQETAKDNSATTSGTTYITGSKELDELVASILGEGWEKEEATPNIEPPIMNDTQLEASGEWPDNLTEQNIDNADDNFDLDALVESILTEDETTSHIQPIEIVVQPDTDTSTGLPDSELTHTESAHNSTTTELNQPTQHPDFEAETADQQSASNATLETDAMAEVDSAEQTLDELINEVLHQDSDTLIKPDKTEAVAVAEHDSDDLDELINEVFNTQDESPATDEHMDTIIRQFNELESSEINSAGLIDVAPTNTTETGTTENVTDSPLSPGMAENSPVTALKSEPSMPASYPPKTVQESIAKPEKIYHKENESRFALVSLLLLVILVTAIGSWHYFRSSNYTKVVKIDSDSEIPRHSVMEERNPAPMEPSPVTSNSTPIEPVRTTAAADSQTGSSAEQEQNSLTQSSEATYTENEYRARIEQNDNDITIVVNEPVEEEPIPLYNEYDYIKQDGENTLDSEILDITPPMQETPKPKIISKPGRKIIIHTVVKGDTLWAIAKRYINNPYKYPELAKLSKIKNPDLIYPGNKVRIIKYSR